MCPVLGSNRGLQTVYPYLILSGITQSFQACARDDASGQNAIAFFHILCNHPTIRRYITRTTGSVVKQTITKSWSFRGVRIQYNPLGLTSTSGNLKAPTFQRLTSSPSAGYPEDGGEVSLWNVGIFKLPDVDVSPTGFYWTTKQIHNTKFIQRSANVFPKLLVMRYPLKDHMQEITRANLQQCNIFTVY